MPGIDIDYCEVIPIVTQLELEADIEEICSFVTAEKPEKDVTKQCNDGTILNLDAYVPFPVEFHGPPGIVYSHIWWLGVEAGAGGSCLWYGVDPDDTTTFCRQVGCKEPGELEFSYSDIGDAVDALFDDLYNFVTDPDEAEAVDLLWFIIAAVVLLVGAAVIIGVIGSPLDEIAILGGLAAGVIHAGGDPEIIDDQIGVVE